MHDNYVSMEPKELIKSLLDERMAIIKRGFRHIDRFPGTYISTYKNIAKLNKMKEDTEKAVEWLEGQTNAEKVNYSKYFNRVRIRVICPVCNTGGAQDIDSYQPKCHVCKEPVLMEPASNNKIECTWQEFINYYKQQEQING